MWPSFSKPSAVLWIVETTLCPYPGTITASRSMRCGSDVYKRLLLVALASLGRSKTPSFRVLKDQQHSAKAAASAEYNYDVFVGARWRVAVLACMDHPHSSHAARIRIDSKQLLLSCVFLSTFPAFNLTLWNSVVVSQVRLPAVSSLPGSQQLYVDLNAVHLDRNFTSSARTLSKHIHNTPSL